MSNHQSTINQDYSSDLIYQLKELEIQMLNSQTEHSRNESVFRTYNYHLEKIKLILRLFQKSIRFDWLQIQSCMDEMYKQDSSLSGCTIHFDFKESDIPNRAFLKYKTFIQHQQYQQQPTTTTNTNNNQQRYERA
jgi:hypothetical protein